MDYLIPPYRGELVNLVLAEEQAEQLKTESESFVGITLTQRQQCDLEMLLNGALSPLAGFMTEKDYSSVLNNTRLGDGTLWPIPYYLDITEEQASSLELGSKLGLRDTEGFMPAVMTIESIWRPDKNQEAEQIYGTTDEAHPGVSYLLNQVNDVYVGGSVAGVQLPFHYDFETLRDTPTTLRSFFEKQGWRNIVAFHTSKPMHRLHQEITLRAAKQANAHILLHPVVGMSKPGDLHYYARVHCYQAIKKHYPKNLVALSLLPMAMRMAGPREALMNLIIRQNYGCSHYIVGTEHAAPPNVRDNAARFYPSGAAQKYVLGYQDEIDIKIIPVTELCYDEDSGKYIANDQSQGGHCSRSSYSNKAIMNALANNETVPSWVTYPEVLKEMQKVHPPRNQQGFTLFFTGLSGSGKSTLAKIIYAKFIEEARRPVTLLDGDIVRLNLSSELGFSRKDRFINVNRIGFVASEITKNRGIAICAPIAPYTEMRRSVRANIEQYGAFIEIHVATPLAVCEQRDRKGLYALARKGIIPEFTGISDPYEEPENPEIRINTADMTPMHAAQEIYLYLVREGYLATEDTILL